MPKRASKSKRATTKRKPAARKLRTTRKATATRAANAIEATSALLDEIELEEAEDARERYRDEHPRAAPTEADRQLVAAAYYGGLDDARKALAAGASPDARNDDGQTALYRAISGVSGQRGSLKRQYTMIEFLLEHGADPNGTVVAALLVGSSRKAIEISPLRRAIDENLRTIQQLLKRHGGRDVYRPLS